MRIGLNMPNFAEFADPAEAVALAREADAAGWDGLFVWDHINFFGETPVPMADPFILLAAIAQATERILIGPMVTPLPRRRPWVLARQTATLDVLSKGRLMLGVGLGFPPDTEFAGFGEEPDPKVRAQKLDEGLEILSGLWSGEPFEFHGAQFQVARTRFLPTPIQRPRPPVIVAGVWPIKAPLRRAARWDGYIPLCLQPNWEPGEFTVEDVAEIKRQLEELRDGRPAEIVIAEECKREVDWDRIAALADAGATWYHVGIGTRKMSIADVHDLVKEGPRQVGAVVR